MLGYTAHELVFPFPTANMADNHLPQKHIWNHHTWSIEQMRTMVLKRCHHLLNRISNMHGHKWECFCNASCTQYRRIGDLAEHCRNSLDHMDRSIVTVHQTTSCCIDMNATVIMTLSGSTLTMVSVGGWSRKRIISTWNRITSTTDYRDGSCYRWGTSIASV